MSALTPFDLCAGLLLVFLAGLLQGTFVLPMTLVREWRWEHTWSTFSLLGMLVFNWIIILLLVPNIFSIYAASPAGSLAVLALCGIAWGIGAVLFGLGMDRLGMSLGYPIIMGLIASLGSLIPLLVFFPHMLFATRGLVLLGGTALVVFGIVLCSLAGSKRLATESHSTRSSSPFVTGLAIAIFAGILSCLPNVGVAFAGRVTATAVRMGSSPASAGNIVWALLFTFGFAVNAGYCLSLMLRSQTGPQYWNAESLRNIGLSAAMAAMWIGSFYFYGAGAAHLGKWGVIVGWPLFISLSIITGNLWGLWRAEWRNASSAARRQLNFGLLALLVAVIVVALSNLV